MSNVIDLDSRRKRPLGDYYDDKAEQFSQNHANADAEFEHLHTNVVKLRDDAFVPGFPTIDDVVHWLTVHMKSGHRQGAKNYDAHQMKQLEMIAQHAPRLIDRLKQGKKLITQFLDKWHARAEAGEVSSNLAAIDNAAFVDHELGNDIGTLEEVVRMFRAK